MAEAAAVSGLASRVRAPWPWRPSKLRFPDRTEHTVRSCPVTAALLAEYPELEGGEPDYPMLATALRITEDEARRESAPGQLGPSARTPFARA